MKPSSILVVDDVSDTLDVIVGTLESLGYHVTAANGGRSALAQLEEQSFDLVITDVLMPDVDGIELIMAVRRHQPGARVVVMSGGGDFFAARELLRLGKLLGAVEQLAKPFSRAQLLGAVERQVGTVPQLAGAA